jgi:hypothetical protein
MGGILGRSEEGDRSDRTRGEAMGRNSREERYHVVQYRGPIGVVRGSYSSAAARTPGQHLSNNPNSRGSADQSDPTNRNREGSNRALQNQVASSYGVTGGQRMGLGGPSSGAGHVANSPGGRQQEGPRRGDEVWGLALEDAGQQLAPLNGHMEAIWGALMRVEEKLQEAKAERECVRAMWATK